MRASYAPTYSKGGSDLCSNFGDGRISGPSTRGAAGPGDAKLPRSSGTIAEAFVTATPSSRRSPTTGCRTLRSKARIRSYASSLGWSTGLVRLTVSSGGVVSIAVDTVRRYLERTAPRRRGLRRLVEGVLGCALGGVNWPSIWGRWRRLVPEMATLWAIGRELKSVMKASTDVRSSLRTPSASAVNYIRLPKQYREASALLWYNCCSIASRWSTSTLAGSPSESSDPVSFKKLMKASAS